MPACSRRGSSEPRIAWRCQLVWPWWLPKPAGPLSASGQSPVHHVKTLRTCRLCTSCWRLGSEPIKLSGGGGQRKICYSSVPHALIDNLFATTQVPFSFFFVLSVTKKYTWVGFMGHTCRKPCIQVSWLPSKCGFAASFWHPAASFWHPAAS